MGPRSIDRGTSSRVNESRGLASLQWGRDQLIAELISPVGRASSAAVLQWGRDQLIAELL